MTKKIAIVVDSGSDVPQSVLDENKNIAVVPLNITMNGHNYLDAVDITPDEFYSALATAETLPQLQVRHRKLPKRRWIGCSRLVISKSSVSQFRARCL